MDSYHVKDGRPVMDEFEAVLMRPGRQRFATEYNQGHFKLTPIERSAVYALFRSKYPLSLSDIAKEIPYCRQDHLDVWLLPIMVRLETIGYVTSSDGRFQCGRPERSVP